MLHKLKLHIEPFLQIKSGKKTIEMRLYDEKRQKINVGDKIEFTCRTDETQKLICKVIALHRFASFAKLYESLPLEKCGYDDPQKADSSDMLKYYPEAEQKKYGVLGIELKFEHL